MDKFSFQVEPFSEDVTGRLSWGVLGNTLLRVAEKAAITHGFGYDTMQKQRFAWVLSRLLIDMSHVPLTGERFDVETWVSRIYRQFTDRHFAIKDESGSPLGYASSVWALISLDTRQPVNLEEIDNPGFHKAMDTKEIPLASFTRCRLSGEATQHRLIDVVHSDLDINGHVNSIRYMLMAVDSLYYMYKDRLNILRHIPTRIEMTYAAETFYGDRLEVLTEEIEERKYLAVLKRSDTTTVSKAVVSFAEDTTGRVVKH